MASALIHTMAATPDWSALPRDGVLRLLADLERALDSVLADRMPDGTRFKRRKWARFRPE